MCSVEYSPLCNTDSGLYRRYLEVVALYHGSDEGPEVARVGGERPRCRLGSGCCHSVDVVEDESCGTRGCIRLERCCNFALEAAVGEDVRRGSRCRTVTDSLGTEEVIEDVNGNGFNVEFRERARDGLCSIVDSDGNAEGVQFVSGDLKKEGIAEGGENLVDSRKLSRSMKKNRNRRMKKKQEKIQKKK